MNGYYSTVVFFIALGVAWEGFDGGNPIISGVGLAILIVMAVLSNLRIIKEEDDDFIEEYVDLVEDFGITPKQIAFWKDHYENKSIEYLNDVSKTLRLQINEELDEMQDHQDRYFFINAVRLEYELLIVGLVISQKKTK